MSSRATTWVSRLITLPSGEPLPPTAKFVLFALADYAGNEHGECWPSIGTIAAWTGHHEETVRKQLRFLADEGLISVETRTAESGRRQSNLYRLIPHARPETQPEVPQPSAGDVPPQSAGDPPPPTTGGDPRPARGPESSTLDPSIRTCVDDPVDNSETPPKLTPVEVANAINEAKALEALAEKTPDPDAATALRDQAADLKQAVGQ